MDSKNERVGRGVTRYGSVISYSGSIALELPITPLVTEAIEIEYWTAMGHREE